MKVILQQTVEKLGTAGEIVEVADGYARNYLLPRRLALPATPGNLRQLERLRARLARLEAAQRSDAERLAQQLSSLTLTIARKAGQNDQLFGSVTAADIAEALAAQGVTVDRRKIQLAEPIKLIGEYEVPIRLHGAVTATVRVAVIREESA
jgi:large subunit ribosomal protein L9